MTAGIIPRKEPRALAGLAVKPPAVFLRDENQGNGSLPSSRPIFATGTRAEPITRRHAGYPWRGVANERGRLLHPGTARTDAAA